MQERKEEIARLKKRNYWLVGLGIIFIIFGITLIISISDGKLVYHFDSGRNTILAVFDFLAGFVLLYLFRKNKIRVKVLEDLNRVESGKITSKQLINKINYCLTLKSIKNSDYVLDRLKEVRKLVESDDKLSEENKLFLNQNLNKLKTIRAKQVSQPQMEAINEICNNFDELIDEVKADS